MHENCSTKKNILQKEIDKLEGEGVVIMIIYGLFIDRHFIISYFQIHKMLQRFDKVSIQIIFWGNSVREREKKKENICNKLNLI